MRNITVESYIFNNKVNFLLRMPITFPAKLNYYQFLFSSNTCTESLKVILPKRKYLLKNKLHYSYRNTECTKIKDQYYVCDKMELQTLDVNSSCEVQLLEAKSHHLSSGILITSLLWQLVISSLENHRFNRPWLVPI